MLNKLKTPVINVAWVASMQGAPKEARAAIEEDFRLLVSLYVSCVMRGKREALLEKINEFCKQEIIEIADVLRGEFQQTNTASVCDDWKRGLRNPHGGCTNCGAKHA